MATESLPTTSMVMSAGEKVFETAIDVPNPINFCTLTDNHVMMALNRLHVGKCFKGAFVVGIKKVLKRSKCRISQTSGSAEGSIDVMFLADVVVYGMWDILVGVHIVNNTLMLVGPTGGRATTAAPAPLSPC